MSASPDNGKLDLASLFPATNRDQWQALVATALADRDFEKALVTQTYEGLDLQPIYSQDDAVNAGAATRNAHALGRTASGWEIRQTVEHPEAAAANRQILQELQRGAMAVSIAMNTASHMPDDTARGVWIPDSAALAVVLEGLYLDAVRIAFQPGADFAGVGAVIVAYLQDQKITEESVQIHFGADPLGALAATGSLPQSLPVALEALAELAGYSAAHLPQSRAVAVDSTVYHAAGADEVMDLALSIATAVAYLRAMTAAGLTVDQALGEIEFTLAAGVDLFLTVAKLRALRRLWARVAEASGGATDDAARAQLHVTTAERVLAVREPWVNMLRATIGGFAAGIAGADSVAVAAFDQGRGVPSDFGRRIARNTQVVLQEESGLAEVIDPAGGSWYIDDLTDRMATAAWAKFQEIEAAGGVAAMLMEGSLQADLATIWASRERDLAHRRSQLIGVNVFANLHADSLAPEGVDLGAENAAWLQRRVTRTVPDDSGFSARVDGVANGVAIADLAAALRGPRAQIQPVGQQRLSAAFEALRDTSDNLTAAMGRPPVVFLAALGRPADHGPRLDFTRNYLAAGGITAEMAEGDVAVIADAFAAFQATSGSNLAIICSSDKFYQESGPAMLTALKAVNADWIGIAGRPDAVLQRAGADCFIYAGDDCLASLGTILDQLRA